MADELITVEITGGNEMADRIRSLGSKLQDKIMRAAVSAGAQIIADEAVTLAPKKSGKLKGSIRVRTSADVDVSEISANVSSNDPVAHLVEFGTQPHEIHAKNAKALKLLDGREVESVMHPGAKAEPFMRPAFDTKSNEALDVIMKVIAEGLDAALPSSTS